MENEKEPGLDQQNGALETSEFERSREEYYQSMAARARGDEDTTNDEPRLENYFGDEEEGADNIAGSEPADEPKPQEAGETTPASQPQQVQPAQRGPLMKLKVDGQEISIHDYNDAVTLAQKGLHYTQQMQALAPYRHVLKALEQNPDLQEELMTRIRGGKPSKKEAKPTPKEPERKIEIPPMREDETYEEWTQRVFKDELPNLVRSEAERIAAAKAEEVFKFESAAQEEARRREKLLDTARADPLYKQTVDFIRRSIESGQIPHTVLQAADEDPKTFAWLYDSARKKIASTLSHQRPAAAMTPAVPAPAVPATPQQGGGELQRGSPSRPPHAEAASGRARPSKGARDYVKVIEDMEDSKFRELLDRVKADAAVR